MLRRELQKDKDKVTEILKTFGESTIEITGWIPAKWESKEKSRGWRGGEPGRP